MIKTALIGNGYWGSKLKRYIMENDNLELRYTCDSKSNLSQVWNDATVRAIVIATPNHTHFDIAYSALACNFHVMCEKPLALTGNECRKLASIAEDRKCVLITEYTHTFSKSLNLIVRLVRLGLIGRLFGFDMCVRHLGRFGGGDVYWLLGSHMLSVLDMFVPIRKLNFYRKDIVTYRDVVETGMIYFDDGDGMAGKIDVSLNFTGRNLAVVIYGDCGTIKFSPLSKPPLEITTYKRKDWVVAEKLPQKHRFLDFDESNNLRYAVDYFVKAIKGEVTGNIERAIAVTDILEGLHSV